MGRAACVPNGGGGPDRRALFGLVAQRGVDSVQLRTVVSHRASWSCGCSEFIDLSLMTAGFVIMNHRGSVCLVGCCCTGGRFAGPCLHAGTEVRSEIARVFCIFEERQKLSFGSGSPVMLIAAPHRTTPTALACNGLASRLSADVIGAPAGVTTQDAWGLHTAPPRRKTSHGAHPRARVTRAL